jgi:hypothetical protein
MVKLLLTVYESIELFRGNVDAGLSLAEQRNDSLSGVPTDDGDGEVCRVLLADDFSNEGLGTDNVQCSDTEQLLGVENTSGLEHLSSDWDGRVDGVGDDKDEGLGAVLGNTLDETLDNAGVDLEQVVTGHARLAYRTSARVMSLVQMSRTRNTSGDDNNVSALESLCQAIVFWQVTRYFLLSVSSSSRV